ncbi:Asd/ArgC dimerization domain-containing protein [Paracoccus sp. JM45]|uniref:Asd/ArgC dimerization domain-containing protein n=1 Tax=Paracoccus sp. JM45 TaxID=2283626 RepID=UPI000E6D102B|nr:Asd/ArgC dimerization domain-containing protein [Paracoccus sp. JM45]RJE79067.1 hypothetical protein DWB67_14035 [Paracoccus sp. JM45]
MVPDVLMPDPTGHTLLATPNCTTAICALPLLLLHRAFGIEAVHVTTLQAISGTDLPGMHAYQAHDNVVSTLPGEARALETEMAHIFNDAFPVTCMATRVPVWRGHTITLMVKLREQPDANAVPRTLRTHRQISLANAQNILPVWQPECTDNEVLCTVEGIEACQNGWVKMSLRGDNLQAATTGLMVALVRSLV